MLKNGTLIRDFLAPLHPDDYLKKMSGLSEFVDEPFLVVLAQHLGQDIVILHVHQHTAANGWGTIIYGGAPIGSETHSKSCPLFLGPIREDWEVWSQISYYLVDHAMTAHMTGP